MRIAIPTNDRKTVAERSGRSSEFAVIEINSQGSRTIEYLENTHEHTHHGEGHNGNEEHGHGDLVELLVGIDIIIGKKFGPHFSRDFYKVGIKMKLTKLTDINDIVNSIEI
ncbi:MAG: hypothetical protein KAG84_05735 [Bacteroidales bacterium]|nr:hypothetical protein [Bacteroidales bacterium]